LPPLEPSPRSICPAAPYPTGVHIPGIPPPAKFATEPLERIRAICDRHGVLLVFDAVITGFGRLGAPFAADFFGVTPGLMTLAKGITSGVIPMGAVLVRTEIYDALMQGPEHLIEFAHGYTYFGPSGCLRGGAGRPRHVPRRGSFRTCSRPRPLLGRRGPFAQGVASCHRRA
jgi:Aminotransferase class-III